MRVLVDAVVPTKAMEAIKLSEFLPDEIVTLYPDQDARTRHVRCPEHPGASRTGVYIMQLQQADALVVVWDGRDMELINHALEMDLPIFILYQNDTHQLGFRANWEEDF